jgi:hypothetical protein
MVAEPQVTAIGHVIQLSVAPVFLFTGVSALLGLLTGRVGRIIDRGRVLEKQLEAVEVSRRCEIEKELGLLAKRARLVNTSIHLCTICALLVCLVVAFLFIGAFLATDLTRFIGLVFICCMLSLFVALLVFLREIVIATRNLRLGPRSHPGAGEGARARHS